MNKAAAFITLSQAYEKALSIFRDIDIMNKAMKRQLRVDKETGEYRNEMDLTDEEKEIFNKYR